MKLEDFPLHSTDKLRYGDTDRQGHVNNAVFATFFETGRVELMGRSHRVTGHDPNLSFVIARLCVDFRREVLWPGHVDCGTGIAKIGGSSVSLTQGLFQNGELVASAESVIVQVDITTHRPRPLGEAMRAELEKFRRGA